jgi:cytochrome c-type biogenesis protein CcmE
MAGLKKQRRIQLIVIGFVCLFAGFGVIYWAAGDALQYFYSPSEIAEKRPADGQIIRIGGLVEVGSMKKSGNQADFVVTDGGATIRVTFVGILPDLFTEGQGMIATGTLEEGTFIAQEILAKHDEEYMPKEVADALKKQGIFKPAIN